MKNIILFLIAIVSTSVFAQEEVPEGWEKIYFENEIAYMNNLTGEITKNIPKGYGTTKKEETKTDESVESNVEVSVHYVVKGDTYSKIARENNMSLTELYSLNNVDNSDKLETGQEIKVKQTGKVSLETGNKYHTVEVRETLYTISKIHGVSVEQLKKLNSLESNQISIGQKLIIK